MGLFRRSAVRRTGPGRYALKLDEDGRALVGDLVEQLRALLQASTDDPNVRRLFPTAYHEDPERDREYQQLVRDELLDRRLATLDVVVATLHDEELDQGQLSAWMAAVNDLRLVIGTTLDVAEDGLPPAPDDPDAALYAIYAYLSGLLDDMVGALRAGLGDDPPSA